MPKTDFYVSKGDSKTATRNSGGPPTQVESSDLSNIFEELSLSPRGGEVFDNTRMAADSDNARKAIETPTPNAVMEKHREFPFPHAEDASVPNSQTMLADKVALKQLAPGQSTLLASTSMQKASPRGNEAKPKLKPPTVLLVDDNQINLRLLSTYINRRNYEIVDEAQNGLEAVHRVEARQEGYDIIFIDITMPSIDGFGATRQIRAIEEKRKKSAMESMGLGGEDLGVDGVGNSSEALSMAQSHTEKAGAETRP